MSAEREPQDVEVLVRAVLHWHQEVGVKNAKGLPVRDLTIRCLTDGQQKTSTCSTVTFTHQSAPPWLYETVAGVGTVCGGAGLVGPFSSASGQSYDPRYPLWLVVDPA